MSLTLPISATLVLMAACGAQSASAADLLYCDAPSMDFGSVWEGAVLEHEFLFEARGPEALSIHTVKADCGCTVTRLEVTPPGGGERVAYQEGTPIVPGAELHLSVQYNTRGKRGDTPRRISLFGSIPGGREEVLVRASVRSWLVAEPSSVDLPDLFIEDETVVRFTVRSREDRPFALTHSGLAVPPQVEVSFDPQSPDDDGRAAHWDVLVRLGPDLPRGTHSYPIQLVSDVPNPDAGKNEDGTPLPFSVVPSITLQVVGNLTIKPSQMAFGMLRGEETIARTVRISSNDPAFRLEEPEARLVPLKEGDDFPLAETATITTREVSGENAWEVQLLFSGLDDRVVRTFLARLVVETGHPEEPRIEIPVSGFRLMEGAPGGAR